MKVVVLKSDPNKLKDVKPKLENLFQAYVTGIEENAITSSEVVSMTLADLLKAIRDGDGSAAIPTLRISPNNDGEFVIDELTLIKDYKFYRYLDTKYVGLYKLITKKLNKGKLFTKFDNMIIPYYIYTTKQKIWMSDEQNLKYEVRYEIECDISQFEFGRDLFDANLIKKIESEISDDMKKKLEETTNYFQKEIGIDYLGFGSYTQKYHNKVYKKYKDNWDEAFKKLDISYKVKVNIRRIGTSKK
jgi:Ger(x)C family germination protein